VWGDDDAERVRAALADLESPLLFGGTPVVVLRRAEAAADDLQERILALLPRLGPGIAHLVLVARAADTRRKLVAACVRAGATHAFPPLDDARAARDWVARVAREEGWDLAPAAVSALVERVGLDLSQLVAEAEKLALHAGRGVRVDVGHVDALVSRVRAHAIEALTDRLARRDLPGAAAALRGLLAEGEPPLRLVGFLASNVRRALHVAELAETGLAADAIAARLGLPAWLVAKQTGRGTAKTLARALGVLRQVDLDLKRSRPADAVLDAALLAIAGARETRR
jgi:DNA polymerase-3 subunit delta